MTTREDEVRHKLRQTLLTTKRWFRATPNSKTEDNTLEELLDAIEELIEAIDREE